LSERAILLLSGGLDSAVALWWARAEGFEALPLTFHYHLRPRAEVRATRRLAELAGVPAPLEIDLPFLKDVEDLRKAGDLANPALSGAPDAYIPARNLVFYALAASRAEAEGAAAVIGGHNGRDPVAFPDSSPRFFRALGRVYRLGVWSYARSPVRIVQPLSGKSKAAVLRLGADLGVPFAETWSCYLDGPSPCGRCASCLERREAFAEVEPAGA
jgi:7-cyano-7-deazaguanine synthase